MHMFCMFAADVDVDVDVDAASHRMCLSINQQCYVTAEQRQKSGKGVLLGQLLLLLLPLPLPWLAHKSSHTLESMMIMIIICCCCCK